MIAKNMLVCSCGAFGGTVSQLMSLKTFLTLEKVVS